MGKFSGGGLCTTECVKMKFKAMATNIAAKAK